MSESSKDDALPFPAILVSIESLVSVKENSTECKTKKIPWIPWGGVNFTYPPPTH